MQWHIVLYYWLLSNTTADSISKIILKTILVLASVNSAFFKKLNFFKKRIT